MLTTKEKGLLIAIINHCIYIETKIPGISFEEFSMNEDLIRLMCFSILQICELAKHFDDEFISKYGSVPWIRIMGMRDRIAHGYDKIEIDKVWDVIQNKISILHSYCNQILEENK